MRRVGREPGAIVVLPAGSTRGTVRIESRTEASVDTDVRKLLDLLRVRVGDRLLGEGRSDTELQRLWSLGPITGTDQVASTTVDTSTRTGPQYLDRVAEGILGEELPKAIDEFVRASLMPGDGVDTPKTPNTSGGTIPPAKR